MHKKSRVPSNDGFLILNIADIADIAEIALTSPHVLNSNVRVRMIL